MNLYCAVIVKKVDAQTRADMQDLLLQLAQQARLLFVRGLGVILGLQDPLLGAAQRRPVPEGQAGRHAQQAEQQHLPAGPRADGGQQLEVPEAHALGHAGTDFGIDLLAIETAPWDWYGARGAFAHTHGRGDFMANYIVEILPGGKTAPVRPWRISAPNPPGGGAASFWKKFGKLGVVV